MERVLNVKTGRNDPCPCGSGKKYKKCCQDRFEAPSASQAMRKNSEAAALNIPAKASAPTAAEINQLVALFNAGSHVEMERKARLLVERHPNSGVAWKALGLSLQMQGKDALHALQKATELFPDAAAHNSLGNALLDLGQLDGAVENYSRALEIKPDFAEAHNNLGNVLRSIGRLDDAMASYRRALEIKPDFAEAYSNLGVTFHDLGRLAEAEANYRWALEIKPDYALAHYNLGNTLQDLSRLADADASYRCALQIKPDFADAHSSLIFILDLTVSADTTSVQEERKRWDAAHAAHLLQQRTHSNIPDPERRLRIGYLSADFREHSASKVFGGMLTRYDRSQFDVFAYSNFKGKDDRLTGLFRQSVTAWRSVVGSSDEAAVEMIREDGIDILVDLSGHTAGNRLLVFARKPAPIQITAWGYATGTGMRAMDVFFTDPVMVPPQEKQYFTEEVRYLPNVVGAFFNEPFPDVNELPALSNAITTFGSFNRLTKISADAYRVWAEVLLAVPRSRLILKTGELDDVSVRERVVGHFTKAGVEADRIIMQGKSSWYEHMQAYNQIDIALDPFPHGGGVTALEGLMMGVPVITLRWPTVVGRLSASIMTTLGLTDWIAETQEQYVELAIQKANDLQSLAELRQQLRGIFISSIIGDQAAYTQVVEQEYRQLWREWCAR